jgi:hypothetical protein
MSLGGGGGSVPEQKPYVPPPNMAPALKIEEEAVSSATGRERRRMAGMLNRSGAATSRAGFFGRIFGNNQNSGGGRSVLGQ